MSAHSEVPVKVNCWVDEGIAPLVEALNQFDSVWTLASCENDGSRTRKGSYVMFAYRGQDAASFAAALRSQVPPAAHLEADWRAGENEPLFTLSCPPEQVPALAHAVSCAHMTR